MIQRGTQVEVRTGRYVGEPAVVVGGNGCFVAVEFGRIGVQALVLIEEVAFVDQRNERKRAWDAAVLEAVGY